MTDAGQKALRASTGYASTISIIARDKQLDKRVYENTVGNYFAIIGMLLLFYVIHMLHWYGVYSLGIHFSEILTIYSLCIFASAILVIIAMLCYGSVINAKKAEHEYYEVKISE